MVRDMTSSQVRAQLQNAKPQLYRLIENEPGVTMDDLMEVVLRRFEAPIIRRALQELVSESAIEMRQPGSQLFALQKRRNYGEPD